MRATDDLRHSEVWKGWSADQREALTFDSTVEQSTLESGCCRSGNDSSCDVCVDRFENTLPRCYVDGENEKQLGCQSDESGHTTLMQPILETRVAKFLL